MNFYRKMHHQPPQPRDSAANHPSYLCRQGYQRGQTAGPAANECYPPKLRGQTNAHPAGKVSVAAARHGAAPTASNRHPPLAQTPLARAPAAKTPARCGASAPPEYRRQSGKPEPLARRPPGAHASGCPNPRPLARYAVNKRAKRRQTAARQPPIPTANADHSTAAATPTPDDGTTTPLAQPPSRGQDGFSPAPPPALSP